MPSYPLEEVLCDLCDCFRSNTTIVQHSSNNVAAAVAAAVVAQATPPPVPVTPPLNFNHSNTPSITQVQAHQAVSQALSHVDSSQPPTPQSQPVEFNHAINYVNKIKVRLDPSFLLV